MYVGIPYVEKPRLNTLVIVSIVYRHNPWHTFHLFVGGPMPLFLNSNTMLEWSIWQTGTAKFFPRIRTPWRDPNPGLSVPETDAMPLWFTNIKSRFVAERRCKV
jgi:hypothetical protein